MKKLNCQISTVLLLALTLLGSASCFAAQNMNCSFSDPSNSDKLIIVLTTDQSGTLQYSTPGDDSETSTTMDGKLKLKRIKAADANFANFSTEVEAMQMIFQMPKNMVLKSGVHFKGTLSTKIDTVNSTEVQDLSCSS